MSGTGAADAQRQSVTTTILAQRYRPKVRRMKYSVWTGL
jgi:hypothetical protein